MDYSSLSVKDTLKELQTTQKGLKKIDTSVRLKKYGLNEIIKEKKISKWKIFVNQFKSMVIYILFAAIIVSMVLGEYVDGVVIALILVVNGVVGFFQEYRAEKAIEALKKLTSLDAVVIRDGKQQKIPVKNLVPGDIIVLEEGSKVPADARLLEVVNFQTLESSLTGESNPISKSIEKLEPDLGVGDQKNMVFSGTIVTRGKAKAVVTNTGMHTELGKIAKMLEDEEEKQTPLQKKLEEFGNKLGYVTIGICVVVFVLGIVRGEEMIKMLLASIALAVAAIPEGLPIVVTISLALGTQRMLKKNALMRRLPSVETLGSTSVICSDKTGTLTKNEMTVRRIFLNNKIIEVSGSGYSTKGEFSCDGKKVPPQELSLLLKIGSLNNDSSFNGSQLIGDPTEGCLVVSAKKAGLNVDELKKKHPRVNEYPFDSTRKMMSTVHKSGKKLIMFTKGAPDRILDNCTKFNVDGKIKKLTPADKKKILAANTSFAKDALRVLGFAYKEVGKKTEGENNLIFLGLQAMIDPPREEVKVAIAKCKTAGVRVVMITGDHPETAAAIAKEIGIVGKTLTGKEIHKLNLADVVEEVSVYARVNPEDKLKIVKALQEKGHVVAMTGDGVNDAPALKAADIGIAMGITGTDVSKEAADMILNDDNFTTIVNAVEEGRGIFDNIKKFINYLLSSNFGEVLVLFIAMLIGFQHDGKIVLPLIAVQLLWMNLITDGLPAIALGVDPSSVNIMKRPARDVNESFITMNMASNIILIGVFLCIATLFMFNLGLQTSVALAQTLAFTTLVVLEIARVYIIRSQYDIPVFSNKYLFGAIVSSIGLHMLIIYTPLNQFFNTTPLSLIHWAYIAGVTVAMLVVGIVSYKLIRIVTKQMD